MRKASFLERLVAIFVDSIAVGIVGWLVGTVIDFQILGLGVSFFVGLAYNWYFWTRNKGQTPGKSLMGLRVVSKGGGGIDDMQAIIRYVGYYINTFLLLLGWLWALVDADNQGLHDKLAGTYVVKA